MGAAIAAIGGVVAAVVAAYLAYWNTRRHAQRQAQLDRVNAQLSEFYGPMLAHASINSGAIAAFSKRDSQGGVLFSRSGPDVHPELLKTWVTWIRTVFMPANRAMVEVITSKTHLIDDDSMPDSLIDLLTHVAGYEVVLDQWSRGDFSQITSIIDHPGPELDRYLRESFSLLKQRQQALIAMTGA